MRLIEVVRAGWGTALLVAPRATLGGVGVRVDRHSVVVARILGARHLTQAALSGLAPSPEVVAMGVWVDGVHALTAAGLAAVDRDRARAGLLDAAVAAVWAGFGGHDLHTGATPPPAHERRRDRAARAVLGRVPGGAGLLAAATARRRRRAG